MSLASLDIFWLKDDSLADSDNLPSPDCLKRDTVESLSPDQVARQHATLCEPDV